jgi:hypothetical protein
MEAIVINLERPFLKLSSRPSLRIGIAAWGCMTASGSNPGLYHERAYKAAEPRGMKGH